MVNLKNFTVQQTLTKQRIIIEAFQSEYGPTPQEQFSYENLDRQSQSLRRWFQTWPNNDCLNNFSIPEFLKK